MLSRALVKNERLKMYKRPSTWILMGIIVVMTLFNLVISLMMYSSYDSFNRTWQEQYNDWIINFQHQLKESPEDYYTQQSLESIKFLLENEIPPQDWRTDVVFAYYDLKAGRRDNTGTDPGKMPIIIGEDGYIPDGETGENQPDLAEEERVDRMEKLQKILKNNDWREYIKLQIDDIKSGYRIIPSKNEQEKQVLIEVYELYLKENIVPVAESMNRYYYNYGQNSNESETWKSSQIERIKNYKLNLLRGENDNGELLTKTMRKALEREMEISLTRLRTNTPEINPDSFLRLLETAGTMSELFAILLIIYASGIFAAEYSSGTIKLLLITPHRRRKIFWSKIYILLELTIIAVAANFILAFLLSGVSRSFEGIGQMQVFPLFGSVIRIPYILYIIIKYVMMIIPVLVYGALAVMLAVVTRKNSVAIAVTLMLVFGNELIITILAALRNFFVIPGIKFLLFANTNLANYLNINSTVGLVDTTMTLGFSVVVLLIYMVCFLWTARDSFCRRDVK